MGTGINTIMQNVLKTDFAITDDFDFIFDNTKYKSNEFSKQGLKGSDVINMCTMNMDLPQMSSNITTVLHGGVYRLMAEKQTPFTCTVTFRDIAGTELRAYFIAIWMAQQTHYFDEIKSSLEIKMDKKTIYKTEDAMIQSISQIQFDNSNTQIVEFSVAFTSPYFTNEYQKEFGHLSLSKKDYKYKTTG